MAPSDHNRVLGLIHGLIGVLVLLGVTAAAVILDARGRPSDAAQRLAWLLYVLPLLQLLTAYGILTKRRWGRMLALVLSALYVWVFPLGTLLSIYTYWFLLSGPARRLYAVTPPGELNGR